LKKDFVMAEPTATRKKTKILSEETKKRKRESDKLKARMRSTVRSLA